VLSACNTGVPLRADDGTPLRSAARTLQSWGKVRTVVSTLWPVVDPSTAAFMRRFYRVLADEPHLTRAEALAKVQTEFIRGEINPTHQDGPASVAPKVLASGMTAVRSSGDTEQAVLPVIERPGPSGWSAPRYWAPFILIGNWMLVRRNTRDERHARQAGRKSPGRRRTWWHCRCLRRAEWPTPDATISGHSWAPITGHSWAPFGLRRARATRNGFGLG